MSQAPETLNHLTGSVAIKFDVYMFVCNEFCAQLPALRLATNGSSKLSFKNCLIEADETLEWFFIDSDFSTRTEACKAISDVLKSRIAGLKKRNSNAADVLALVASKLNLETGQYPWDIAREPAFGISKLEEYHTIGIEIARSFYADSQFSVTKDRLSRQSVLSVEYVSPSDKQPPTAFCSYYKDVLTQQLFSDVIRFRFAFRYRIRDYLALPYFFAHEYTAHIFAYDYGKSERFHDGWMLHALDYFILNFWPETKLDDSQAWAFRQLILREPGYIAEIRINGHDDADQFHKSLIRRGDGVPDTQFMKLIYELAAYVPKVNEASQKRWPGRFINALVAAYISDRDALLNNLQLAKSAEELWKYIRS